MNLSYSNSRKTRPSTMEANSRGPNHPMNSKVAELKRVQIKANAFTFPYD